MGRAKLPADPAIGELVAALPDGGAMTPGPPLAQAAHRINLARNANRELQRNFAEGSACWVQCETVDSHLYTASVALQS